MAWIDLSLDYEFTDQFYDEVKAGKVLVFDYEGSEIAMKIKRIKGKKVWAENITLYRPDEVAIKDKVE